MNRMIPSAGLAWLVLTLFVSAPALGQIEPAAPGGDATPTATPDGADAAKGELRRGGYTQEQFEQEGFTEEVALLQERQSKLRQQKIRKLKEILEANPYHPNKADLFFRLAETYWEESHYQYLAARQDYDKAYEEFEAGRLSEAPPEPREDYSVSLDYYRKIVAQFPDYSRIDEVYYYLGLGALKAGKAAGDRALEKEGVRHFQKLVQDYPKSRFIADAHLKLGEFYFENNSLYYAKVNYEKIISNYKTAGMYNYALYKLGWVYFNLREFRKAIETFEAVVEEISAAGGIRAKIEFKNQALNDLVVTFAEVEEGWQEAREYFTKIIGEEAAYKKLRKLADLYVAQDKDQYALELYNHLLEHEPNSTRVPFYFDRLVEVRKRLNVWAETEGEMRRMIKYFDKQGTWWAANKGNKDALKEAHTQAENTQLFIANKYHRQAEKFEDKHKAKEAQAAYAQAAKDYEVFLKLFPESKKAYIVNFYFAEILYGNLHDYERAAHQYEEVIKKDPKGDYVEDAALGVIYCYEELMVKAGLRQFASKGKKVERVKLSAKEVKKRRKPIKRTPLHELEKGYIAGADKYVELLMALIKDPAFDKQEAERAAAAKKKGIKYTKRGADIPRIMFIAADVFYKHGMFEDAVKRLKTIFAYDPHHEFASYAVNRLLDAYVRLRHWDKVEEWARKLIEVKNFKLKSKHELERIIATAMNEQARDYVAERRTSDAVREMKRLLKEFRHKDPELAAKVMYNLGAVYERAHDMKQAIKTYQRVVKQYAKFPVAAEAQFTIGLIYEGQTMFSKAAQAFEALGTKKFKDFDRTPTALLNAALLREAIQDWDGARAVYRKYIKLYKSKDKIKNIPDVFFRIGVVYELEGTPASLKDAHDHFLQYVKKYRKKREGSPRVVEALARAGRVLKEIDKEKYRKEANKLFARTVAEFNRLTPEQQAGTARHQAAMAMFETAEYVFDDYTKVHILATDPRELRRVLTKKAELFQKAEKLYDKVLLLKSSGWTAGAMFRQGLLYYDFAENLLNAPIPEDLPEEMQGEYVMALEEFAGPVQEKSLLAFQSAMQFAREKGVYNKWSRQSGQYAAKVNPDQFPLAKEPYVKPNEVNDTLAAQAFLRSLRRGDVEVQILKWQKKKVRKTAPKPAPATPKPAPKPAPATTPAPGATTPAPAAAGAGG